MRRKRNSNSFENDTGSWMTTYSDLVTLLLCFFVLLFAFSTIDVKKFEAIMKSFQGSLGVMQGGRTLQDTPYVDEALDSEKATKEIEEIKDLKILKEEIEEYLNANGKEDQIFIGLDDRGLLIRFKDNVLFDSGRAELKLEAKQTLGFLSELLNKDEFIDKLIQIEGHTDTDPILHSNKFPTNWELSVMRASNVVRFFIEELAMDPVRFSASGYSEYHPVAQNDTKENKARNRRVDIVILRSNFVKQELNY
jgi:chemotaxis protein MotB